MNTAPLDESLFAIDINEDPCFQVYPCFYGKDNLIGDQYRYLMVEIVKFAEKHDKDSYNDIFRGHRPDRLPIQTEHVCITRDPDPDIKDEWRLIWRDFVIGWYKHPVRCLTINRLLTDEEREQLLKECTTELLPFLQK